MLIFRGCFSCGRLPQHSFAETAVGPTGEENVPPQAQPEPLGGITTTNDSVPRSSVEGPSVKAGTPVAIVAVSVDREPAAGPSPATGIPCNSFQLCGPSVVNTQSRPELSELLSDRSLPSASGAAISGLLDSAATVSLAEPQSSGIGWEAEARFSQGGGCSRQGAEAGKAVAVRLSTSEQLISSILHPRWVGQGAQGAVVCAEWRGGCAVAVKWVVTTSAEASAAFMEALVAKMLAHPYLVQAFDYSVCLLQEDCFLPTTAKTAALAAASVPDPLRTPTSLPAYATDATPRASASAPESTSCLDGSSQPTHISHGSAAAATAAASPFRRPEVQGEGEDGQGSRRKAVAPPVDASADSFDLGDGRRTPRASAPAVSCLEVLQSLGACPGKYVVQLVSEWCDEGTLHGAIRRGVFRAGGQRSRAWALRALLRTAREVALGMCHLHTLSLIHGDLKPGNVLLKSSRVDSRGFVAKVGDFGLSRLCGRNNATGVVSTAEWGTVPYMAGEYLDNRLMKSSDVYSFGVLLWQMYTGRAPFAGHHEAQVAFGVMTGDLSLEWPDHMPPPLARLGQACCRHKPEDRPTFKEVAVALSGIEAQVRQAHAQGKQLRRVGSLLHQQHHQWLMLQQHQHYQQQQQQQHVQTQLMAQGSLGHPAAAALARSALSASVLSASYHFGVPDVQQHQHQQHHHYLQQRWSGILQHAHSAALDVPFMSQAGAGAPAAAAANTAAACGGVGSGPVPSSVGHAGRVEALELLPNAMSASQQQEHQQQQAGAGAGTAPLAAAPPSAYGYGTIGSPFTAAVAAHGVVGSTYLPRNVEAARPCAVAAAALGLGAGSAPGAPLSGSGGVPLSVAEAVLPKGGESRRMLGLQGCATSPSASRLRQMNMSAQPTAREGQRPFNAGFQGGPEAAAAGADALAAAAAAAQYKMVEGQWSELLLQQHAAAQAITPILGFSTMAAAVSPVAAAKATGTGIGGHPGDSACFGLPSEPPADAREPWQPKSFSGGLVPISFEEGSTQPATLMHFPLPPPLPPPLPHALGTTPAYAAPTHASTSACRAHSKGDSAEEVEAPGRACPGWNAAAAGRPEGVTTAATAAVPFAALENYGWPIGSAQEGRRPSTGLAAAAGAAIMAVEGAADGSSRRVVSVTAGSLGAQVQPPAAERWLHTTGLSPSANGLAPAGPWPAAPPAPACTYGTAPQPTPYAVLHHPLHPLHLPQQQEAREDDCGSSSCSGSARGSNTSAMSLSCSRTPQPASHAHASSAVLTGSSSATAHAGSCVSLSLCAQTPVACRTPHGYASSSTSASNYSPFTPPAARLPRPLPPLPPLPAVRRSGSGTSTSLPGYAPLPMAPPPGASPLGWAAGAPQHQRPYTVCGRQQHMHQAPNWHQLYQQQLWATGIASGPGASSGSAGGAPSSAWATAAAAPSAPGTSAVGQQRIGSARTTPPVGSSPAAAPSCPVSSACSSPLWVGPGGAGAPVVSGPAAVGCPTVAQGQTHMCGAQSVGSLGRCGSAEPMLYGAAGAAGAGGGASGPGPVLQRLVVRADAGAGGVGGSSRGFVHCAMCTPLAPLHEAAEGGP